MSKRRLAIAAGVLLVAGAAVAIAAGGHRGMRGEDEGPGFGMGGWGGGDRRHGGSPFGDDEGPGGRGYGGFWRSRSVSADDFDARTRERFARLDKNSDGVIDAAEATAAIEARAGQRRPFAEMMQRRLMGRGDTDRDGKITRTEFLDRVAKDFARLDLNGDGRITDEDLPPVARGRGVLKGEVRGPIMEPMGRGGPGGAMLSRLIAADANKDGIITRDEAIAEGGRQFDLLDRNKDGVIDKADHDAMRKEMVDYAVQRFMHANGAGPDRTLSREQFFKTAKERFAERDLNNDGRLDRDDAMPSIGPGFGPGPGGRGHPRGFGAGEPDGVGPGRGEDGRKDRAPGR